MIKTIFARIIGCKEKTPSPLTKQNQQSTKKNRICNPIEGSLSLVDPIGFRKEKPGSHKTPPQPWLYIHVRARDDEPTGQGGVGVVLGSCTHPKQKEHLLKTWQHASSELLVFFFQLI